MTNKERYEEFCKSTYVPIFSKSWWMDCTCGPDNWDVWVYDPGEGEELLAAMPYYVEWRGDHKQYKYITKAPLTQNNGIIFRRDSTRKFAREMEMQERIINEANEFIKTLNLDVYEQQYHRDFQNWSPFFWLNYTCLLRYTYVIEDTSDMEKVMEEFTPNYRKNIRKGQRLTSFSNDIDPDTFFDEHGKIFAKQGLPDPISYEMWDKLIKACKEHDAGDIICARDPEGNIHSLMFIVWDDEALYPILGGYMPEYANSQSYPALTYYSIELAHNKGLAYDFEGTMIHRVAKSFRQFGAVPKPYYRVRKVFNPEIVRREAEQYIDTLANEGREEE